MLRLRFLLLAAVVAGLGAAGLLHQAEEHDRAIRAQADERLKGVGGPVAVALQTDLQAALVSVRAIAANPAVGQAMDGEGKPTAEALEAARGTLEKSQLAEAERPVLLVIATQGVAGRYRAGQSNRFDRDLTAFPPLSEAGVFPRASLASLDGESYRFALAQFDNGKVPGTKGLIGIGLPLDDGFAQRLQQAAAGVEIAVAQRGKVLGTTLPASERAALQSAAATGRPPFDFGDLSGDRFAATDLFPTGTFRLPLFADGHHFRAIALSLPSSLPPDLRILRR